MNDTALEILEGKCNFNDVPAGHRSYAVCIAGLAVCGYHIECIPTENLTEELCIAAIRRGPGVAFENIPREKLTYNICFEAIKRNGYNLEFVPEEYRDTDMYLETVKKFGCAMQFIPENNRTVEICKLAIGAMGYGLRYIPEHLKKEMYTYAIARRYGNIFVIPQRERTKELFLLAHSYGLPLDDIPSEYVPELMILENIG